MRFRAEVLMELRRIIQQWVQEAGCRQKQRNSKGLPIWRRAVQPCGQVCVTQGEEDLASRAGSKIFTFGSYRSAHFEMGFSGDPQKEKNGER